MVIWCNVIINYTFAAGDNFGMANGGTGEFNDDMIGTAGSTYVIMLNNWTQGGAGMDFTWQGTAAIAPAVDFSVSPTTVQCGATATFNITDNSTGVPTWDFGNGNTYTGNNPPDQTYPASGTYNIVAVIGGACPSVFSQSVSVIGPFTVAATTVAESCPTMCDGEATVTPTGGSGEFSYSWNMSGPNPSTPTVTGLCAGDYDVTVTDDICGTQIITTVTITSGSTVSAGLDAVDDLCSSAGTLDLNTLLSGNSGAGTWAETTSSGQFTSGTGVFNGSGLSAGDYTFTFTVPGIAPCPEDVADFTITIISPIVTTSDEAVCFGESIDITASGALTYSWSPATELNTTTGATVTSTPTADISYIVTGTDVNGCTNTATANITILPCATPTMDPAPADLPVACPSDVPAMVDLTWVDACAGTGVVTGVDVSNGATCPEIITRTWTYTNPCG